MTVDRARAMLPTDAPASDVEALAVVLNTFPTAEAEGPFVEGRWAR